MILYTICIIFSSGNQMSPKWSNFGPENKANCEVSQVLPYLDVVVGNPSITRKNFEENEIYPIISNVKVP